MPKIQCLQTHLLLLLYNSLSAYFVKFAKCKEEMKCCSGQPESEECENITLEILVKYLKLGCKRKGWLRFCKWCFPLELFDTKWLEKWNLLEVISQGSKPTRRTNLTEHVKSQRLFDSLPVEQEAQWSNRTQRVSRCRTVPDLFIDLIVKDFAPSESQNKTQSNYSALTFILWGTHSVLCYLECCIAVCKSTEKFLQRLLTFYANLHLFVLDGDSSPLRLAEEGLKLIWLCAFEHRSVPSLHTAHIWEL